MDELRFDGRSVIITGAGRGVGRCHALLLASRGARVVVADYGVDMDGCGTSSGPADEVVTEIRDAGGEAVACYADVSDEAGAASIIATAIEAFGGVDVVVNNAGIAAPVWFDDEDHDQFRRMTAVHYFGTVYVTKAAWPHLKAAGHGRVVNTCSEALLGTVPKNIGYGGAKGAVLGFTRALAVDGIRFGIHVNAVAPRANTRMMAPSLLAHVFDAPEELFAGDDMRQFKPEHVSPAAAFLAHQSCALNGEVLVAGAGQVVRMAFLESEGITREDLSPEVIAENLDTVMDVSRAQPIVAGTLMG
jgi:NAD(P)-dependent dehydrogenase (short-subunit alcohol dehydrogenase family)